MSKPSLTLTLDRTVNPQGDPIRLALTLNVWASRDQVDIEDGELKQALAKAASVVEAELFSQEVQPAPRCETCRFLDPDRFAMERHKGLFGICRKNPPTASAADDPAPNWPLTRTSDWCGEYERRVAP